VIVGLAVALVLVLALGLYAAWTAGRLDRQHLRLDAARAALDAALTLRAELAELAGVNRGLGSIERPETAIDLSHERERAENQVSRAIRDELESDRLDPAQRAQLLDAVTRAGFVRRFHNDAVRDALALRRRRMVRLLHLFGHAPLPQYFEIDDVASEISDVARASAPYD
jgi:hypothetical protein